MTGRGHSVYVPDLVQSALTQLSADGARALTSHAGQQTRKR